MNREQTPRRSVRPAAALSMAFIACAAVCVALVPTAAWASTSDPTPELPQVSIAAQTSSVSEGAPVVFTLSRTVETAELTVAVSVTESESMLDGTPPAWVTFGAGEVSATLSAATVDDGIVDEASIVTATISDGSGYSIAPDAASAAMTVADNGLRLLLPDLVSEAPDRMYPVKRTHWAGEDLLVLRFSGYISNVGDGPLDLSGNPQLSDPTDPTSHDVWQRARNTADEWVNLTKPPVRYQTADGHSHFHLMRIVEYSLWNEAGTVRALPAQKVGFCLMDVRRRSRLFPSKISPSPGAQTYTLSAVDRCQRQQPDTTFLRMGVTEGWTDVYSGGTTFQWVDVSDLTPGIYRLAAEADPYDVVVESDETNNGVVFADAVSVVPGYVAQPQTVVTSSSTAADISLAAETFGDPGPLRYRVVTAPTNGTLDVTVGTELSSPTVRYTPNAGFSGVDEFEFTAFDQRSAYPRTSAVASVVIDVAAAESAVSISGAPISLFAETSVDLDAVVIGAGPSVTWSVNGIDGGSPDVGTIDSDGVYSAPATVPSPGSVTIRATSVDAPALFVEVVVAIEEVPNTAPAITDPGAQTFFVGDPVDVSVAAADAEGDSLAWSVDVLPAGLDIVAQTGRIVGNPTEAGSSVSTVTVTDGELSSSVAISWDIAEPPPDLTASFDGVPATHDGSTAFSFELTFSDEAPISYVTLRDSMLEVTGGRVTKARRLARPSNLRWQITVEPTRSGDVHVVLPAAPACDAPAAICTDDSRPLSTRLEHIVSGPTSVPAESESVETGSVGADTEQLWVGTVDVGYYLFNGTTYHGYSVFTNVAVLGALEDTDAAAGLPSGAVDYVIVMGTGSDRILYLGLRFEPAGNVAVVIDGQRFALADAQTRRTGSYHYQWPAADLNWNIGDRIRVELTLTHDDQR